MKTQINGNIAAITIGNVTKEFAIPSSNYHVVATKFSSGQKVWSAHLEIRENGTVHVWGGGYNNKGGAHQIVGWFEPGKEYNSKR